MKKRAYLSGNMTPTTLAYMMWTSRFENDEILGESYEFSGSKMGHDKTPRMIVRHDLARLSRCDLLILNLGLSDISHRLTGAVVETYEACRMGIPVYAFTADGFKRAPQADSPWVSEFITHEFESEEALVDFLSSECNL